MTSENTMNSNDTSSNTEPPINLIPKINLVPHTVFVLCGPTSSGKSQFAEDIANLSDAMMIPWEVISSDRIRKDLLKISNLSPYASSSKYTQGMQAVSEQAFKLLITKYRAAVSFPISTEIVVIDTTGMDEKFRELVLNIGKENGYKVVLVTFEYKNRSDYFHEEDTESEKAIIENSVIKFRRKILPALKAKNFDERLRISYKESFGWDLPRDNSWWFEGASGVWEDHALTEIAKQKIELQFECSEINYNGGDGISKFAVIGDSHECVDELQLLISRIPEEYRIIHVGDYLDKGNDTLRMVDLMYGRISTDIVIIGNHENYVYKRLKGMIEPNLEIEKDYFTSVSVLEKSEEHREKFFKIFEQSLPFAVINTFAEDGSLPVYITHAPCLNSELGKVHDNTLTAQRNYRIKDREKSVQENLNWLYKEADASMPLHIFGHVTSMQSDRFKKLNFKNKVFLDTGAVYGGDLTAVLIENGKIASQIQIKCKTRVEDPSVAKDLAKGILVDNKFNILDYDLEARDLRLLDQVMKNGVRYISGTMAPAPSSNEKIEPLEGAFNFFKNRGVTEVTLESKYMGSRCQLYLYKGQPEKTFAVSRGGWVIKGVHGKTPEEYKQFLLSEHAKRASDLETYGDMIIDGELLPWMALGEGLITSHFYPYGLLVNHELTTLASDSEFSKLTGFATEMDVSNRQQDLKKFHQSLALFTKDTPVEFRPFKVLYNSDTSVTDWSKQLQSINFKSVNKDAYLKIDTTKPEEVEVAKQFFNVLTIENGMEGLVVKAEDPNSELPFLKVRSEEYLRIVYGYDYTRPERYLRLCRQKNISGKVRTSIQEHALASAMLTANDEDRKMYVVKMIGQMKQEKLLDPRL